MAALDDPLRLGILQACGLIDGSGENDQLDRLTELASHAIGAPVSLVSLVTPEKQVFSGITGLGGWAGESRETPLSHSFCQYVVNDEEPLVIEDARTDPRLADNLAIPDLDVIAYLGVPIRSDTGAILGSFCVIDTQPRKWTQGDRQFVETLAASAAGEIDRQARVDNLMQDLRRRLVPRELPEVEWADIFGTYEALGHENLGGDFYDVSTGSDGRVLIALGDIVGHGVDATVAMGQLRAAAGIQMYAGRSMREIMTSLDGYVLEHFPGIRNAALTLVSIWPDGRIEHLRAGAWPPLIFSAGGEVRPLREGSSWPIASVDGDRPDPTTDHLQPGETIIMFSDGLPEGHEEDPDRAMETLRSALSTFGQAAIAEVHRVLAASLPPRKDRSDDLAIISLRRTR